MKKIFLTILLFSPLILAAQVERTHEFSRLRYGIEVGMETFMGKTIDIPQIRESRSAYFNPAYMDDLYYCGFMYDRYEYTRFFVGFKPEYSLNHNFALAAGLRFSYNNSEFNSDRKYFLWKVAESGQTTNYVRINNFMQHNFYLGVPVEIKFFPVKSDVRVRQYFKAGLVFNALVATATKINFQNSAMADIYNSQIAHQLQKPSIFSAQAILGIGLKFERMNHPFGNIEIQIPINMLQNQRASSFAYSNPVSIALIATVNIPAGKQKLSYTYKTRN